MWSEKGNDFTTYFCAKLGKMPVRFTDTLHPNCPCTKTIDGAETRVQVPPEQISDAIVENNKNNVYTAKYGSTSAGLKEMDNVAARIKDVVKDVENTLPHSLKQTLYVNMQLTRFQQATKIPLKEAWEEYTALYLENNELFVTHPAHLDDLIKNLNLKPSEIRLYGVRPIGIKLDASDIVKYACFSQELHEDAYASCDLETLQRLLNLWCLAETGTMTYFPDFSIGVTYGAGQKT